MRSIVSAMLVAVLALGSLGTDIALGADGHDHGQAHGPAKATKKSGATVPTVTASSEHLELSGTLRDGRLNLRLTGRKDGGAVKDARVEIAIDGETAIAVPQNDGSYILETPALSKPGEHEVIATISWSGQSDLLVGTLSSGARAVQEDAFDHDHASHHAAGETTRSWLGEISRRPLATLGAAVALLACGIAIGIGARLGRAALRNPLIGGVLAVGIALIVGGMVQGPSGTTTSPMGSEKADAAGHKHGEAETEGAIEMPPERIAAAQIGVGTAGRGMLERKVSVPGVIVPDAGKQARVPAQVVGMVAEMRKHIGDLVERGEVIAVISSREVADAKSEYLAALVNADLQKTLFERSQALWEKRVTPEQQFLQVKATYTQARLRVDLARQKLSSLGLNAATVEQEAKEDATSQGRSRLRTYEVRAPFKGRVVERKVDVGTPVGKEGDASELYSIADLSSVWVDLAVPLADLAALKEQQRVSVKHDQQTGEAKIVFISPVVSAETRSARVVAALDNPSMTWRPGTYVAADVAVGQEQVGISVPRAAVQTIEGKAVVFVRSPKGFMKREVSLGRGDGDSVEIVAGLAGGEVIAVSNTFLLKADLGKSEAEHSH